MIGRIEAGKEVSGPEVKLEHQFNPKDLVKEII